MYKLELFWKTAKHHLKANIRPFYDPAIQHLGLYPTEMSFSISRTKTVFEEALFKTANRWKQPQCLPTI